jgi:hypothetical protein
VLLVRVEAVGGLVHDQHRRVVQDRLREADAALVALRQGLDPQTIPDNPPNSSPRTVVFEDERLDANNEYNPATGRFTAKAAGLYQFHCTIAWNAGANSNGTWEAAIEVNAFEHVYSGHYGDGVALTKTATAAIELEPNDDVTCTGLTTEAGGTALNVHSGSTFNTFAGYRIR